MTKYHEDHKSEDARRLWRREYRQRYYQENKELYGQRHRAILDANRELYRRIKMVPCADCGTSYPYYVMDFHHRNPAQKTNKVSSLLTSSSQERILDEMSKCDVLCANCHRIRSYGGNVE